MDDLTWRMTINGLTSYQYGPWIETIINKYNGLISYIPKYKGCYEAVITCEDARGGTAFGEIIIFCTNRTKNDNGQYIEKNSPVITGTPEALVTVRAGQELILATPDIGVYDPDGDELFASCNIGSIKQNGKNNFIWTFSTYFPGLYEVQIIFFDIYGEYKIMEFIIDVKPWWSY